jgi:hypothetical protein
MKRYVKLVLLGLLILVVVLIYVPKVFWWMGWAPSPLKKVYDNPTLGIRISKPPTEDHLDWVWLASDTDKPAGIFLQTRNRKRKAAIDFVYFPAEPGVKLGTWLEELRTVGQYYSNFKRKDISINGVEAIEEISDYTYPGRTLRYYTVVMKHRQRFIVMECSTDAPHD